MAVRKGNSLGWLLSDPESVDDLLWDHKMDISASVHKRMTEVGMSQTDLAKKMGMDRSQLSRLLSGDGNVTLRTIARLEVALDFRLDGGFKYGVDSWSSFTSRTVIQAPPSQAEVSIGSLRDGCGSDFVRDSGFKGALIAA